MMLRGSCEMYAGRRARMHNRTHRHCRLQIDWCSVQATRSSAAKCARSQFQQFRFWIARVTVIAFREREIFNREKRSHAVDIAASTRHRRRHRCANMMRFCWFCLLLFLFASFVLSLFLLCVCMLFCALKLEQTKKTGSHEKLTST